MINKTYSFEDKNFKVHFHYILDDLETERVEKETMEKIINMIEYAIYFEIERLCSKFPKKCGGFYILLKLWDIRNIHKEKHYCSFQIHFDPLVPSLDRMALSTDCKYYNLVFRVNKLDSQNAEIRVHENHLGNQIKEFFKIIPDQPY